MTAVRVDHGDYSSDGSKVTSYAISAKNDTERFSKFFHGMLDRGVYLPCSQFEANFVSMEHTAEDINQTIAAAREVLAVLSVEC